MTICWSQRWQCSVNFLLRFYTIKPACFLLCLPDTWHLWPQHCLIGFGQCFSNVLLGVVFEAGREDVCPQVLGDNPDGSPKVQNILYRSHSLDSRFSYALHSYHCPTCFNIKMSISPKSLTLKLWVALFGTCALQLYVWGTGERLAQMAGDGSGREPEADLLLSP